MEEARKQLDQLRVFTDYPRLIAENATLQKQLDTVTQELSSLQSVERVVGDATLTLPELRQRVLDIDADAIEQETKRRLDGTKRTWETTERPQAVRRKALALLETMFILLRRPPPHYFPSDVIELELHTALQELLNNEVQSRLDQAFENRVDAAVQRRTMTQLDAAKREAWPRWVETHLEPRIHQLETAIHSNVVETLRGPWRLTCQTCGMTDPMELTPDGMDTLLRTGRVTIPCENAPCRGRTPMTLRELLTSLLISYLPTES
jgi:hypothetical protein